MQRDDPRSVQVLAGEDELLALVRSKERSDHERLLALPTEALAAALTSLSPRARSEFLERFERGPELVPHLPETVFTSAVLATGVENAAWLVEAATPEQRVAAVDLDCWTNHRPIPERFVEWIDTMIDAGPETLVRAFEELDLALWIVLFQRMASFRFLSATEPAEVPTIDGMIGIEARTSEDEERVLAVLKTALSESPEHYWRFVIGAMNESATECQEEAATMQRGRLGELGFPERGQAMRVYRPLPVDAVPRPAGARAPTPDALVVRTPLPALLAGSRVGDALAGLGPERAAERFADLLVVANALAVADELPLAEPESVSRSLEKAVRGIERGLVALAEAHAQTPTEVLDRTAPMHLFRVGATLDATLRPAKTIFELETEEASDPWAVRTEALDDDATVVGDAEGDGDEIAYGSSTLRTGRLR